MNVFPDLSRYDRYSFDTEGTGLGPRDVPVGASISTPDGQDHYLRWGHKEGGNNCSLAEFVRWSRAELLPSRPGRTAIMFNARHDLYMLANVGVQVGDVVEDPSIVCALANEYEPGGYSLDQLSQNHLGRTKQDQALNEYCAKRFGGPATRSAQAPNYWKAHGDMVAPYAKDDSRNTLDLFDARYPEIARQDLWRVYQTETTLTPVLVKMYRAGVRINVQQALQVQTRLVEEYGRLAVQWDKVCQNAGFAGGFKFTQRNNMYKLLSGMGINVPKTLKGNPRMDRLFLAELAEMGNPLGNLIKRMRQLTHYSDTFIQNYLMENIGPDEFVHPNFWQVQNGFGGTITGRFSSSGGLNAQNIPARDEEWAPLIRGMFIPMDEDSDWLKADMSQIEYRFFAHYAGGNMRRAYNDDPDTDFHQFVMDLTGLKRKQAKNTNFAKLYGAGIPKFALTAGISEDEAREIMEIYDTRIPEAKRLYRKAMNIASVRGELRTWGGRVLRFRSVGQVRKKYLATHAALNKLLQGSSADQIKESMIAVDQVIDWETSVMHMTVHDELDFSVPKGEAGVQVGRLIKEAMEDHECSVPLRAEVKIGRDWAHAETQPALRLAA
jgi:DNA polymerase I-like protein with 3'-5' exonuclease and polymerase domains